MGTYSYFEVSVMRTQIRTESVLLCALIFESLLYTYSPLNQ